MNIAWMIFVFLVLAWLQSYLFQKRALKRIEYARFFNEKAVFAGERVELVERVANLKLLPVPWLRLESSLPAQLKFHENAGVAMSEGKMFQHHHSFFSLMPYSQITRRYDVRCPKRGCYTLSTVHMTAGDPLGINRVSQTVPCHAELLVYPQLLPLNELDIPQHSWFGDLVVRRWTVFDPFERAGVREYQYGDPLKSVNWTATARTGELQVNRQAPTSNPKLLIYVNFDVSEKMWNQISDPDMVEHALSVAATLAVECISQGIEVGFCCNGRTMDDNQPVRIPIDSGHVHESVILDALARLIMERSTAIETMLEEEIAGQLSDTDIVLISAYVNARMEEAMEQLKRLGNAVSVYRLQPSVPELNPEEVGASYADQMA